MHKRKIDETMSNFRVQMKSKIQMSKKDFLAFTHLALI